MIIIQWAHGIYPHSNLYPPHGLCIQSKIPERRWDGQGTSSSVSVNWTCVPASPPSSDLTVGFADCPGSRPIQNDTTYDNRVIMPAYASHWFLWGVFTKGRGILIRGDGWNIWWSKIEWTCMGCRTIVEAEWDKSRIHLILTQMGSLREEVIRLLTWLYLAWFNVSCKCCQHIWKSCHQMIVQMVCRIPSQSLWPFRKHQFANCSKAYFYR